MINRLKHFLYGGVFILSLTMVGFDCNRVANLDGQILANQYCSSCHLFPQPTELPLGTWRDYVLPRMGNMLGIYQFAGQRDSLIEQGPAQVLIEQANIYPQAPLISQEEWSAINEFYLDNAPDELLLPQEKTIKMELNSFIPQAASIRLSPPSTTLTKILSGGKIFIGDANTQALYLLDQQQNLEKAAKLREGAVHLEELAQSYLVTIMGSFSPTDAPLGLVMALPKDQNRQPTVLIDQLQRPVHTAIADFNRDQRPEFVIAEFGKWTGRLSLWSLQNGKYVPTILKQQTGAIRSVIADLNNDQREDIVALFGQGAESISVFYQQPDGTFLEEQLLQFPATYGSSYFDLQDLDADGDLDIVYTNGDNADYPPILKPYHGIRFFTNQGTQQFEESFFYPLYGAYKAIPADFDQDGDLDIAAISFFPDFSSQPELSFTYLDNLGDGQFRHCTLPEAKQGRWLTMDIGDINQDGDTDLILGSLSFEVVPPTGILNQWVESGIPYLILNNQTSLQ